MRYGGTGRALAGLMMATSIGAATSRGSVVLTGSVTPDPATTDYSTTVYVARTADGSVTVEGGSKVASYFTYVGYTSGYVGSVTVTGAGSTWNPDATQETTFVVGYRSPGTFNVLAGGTANAVTSYVGRNAGAVGTVNVSGAGSTWNIDDYSYVGNSGTGTVNVSAGAHAETSVVYVGYLSGSVGTLNLDGAGTTWHNDDGVGIGWASEGHLSITNGASMTVDSNCPVGANSASAVGTVLVDGKGSAWTAAEVDVGYHGQGTATISNGGRTSAVYTYVGIAAEGTGKVEVTGGGSTLATGDEFHVGDYGNGTLLASDGATVTNGGRAYVGANAGAIGVATISGAGTTWISSGEMYVGNFGAGTLTVSDGAVVASGRSYIGSYGGQGSVTVGGNGATWNVNGALDIGYQSTAATLTIQSGGTVNVYGDLTISGYSLGAGTLVLSGGVLDLHGHSIVQGPGAAASITFSGGRLAGVSSLGTSLTQTGGTLAAGASPGVMSIAGDYTLGAGGTLEVDLAGTGGAGGTDFDLYTIAGTATLAGTLDLNAYGGFTPTAGETFDVLTATSIDATGLSLADAGFTVSVVDLANGAGQALRVSTVSVPEPGMAIGALGTFALLEMRRRRR